jgi:hypothetical protein
VRPLGLRLGVTKKGARSDKKKELGATKRAWGDKREARGDRD